MDVKNNIWFTLDTNWNSKQLVRKFLTKFNTCNNSLSNMMSIFAKRSGLGGVPMPMTINIITQVFSACVNRFSITIMKWQLDIWVSN